MSELIKNRYDFVLLFDVTDGNPNGDPDAGNLPRVDAETGMGLVTDVCIKRKVRNFVQITQKEKEHYDVFVKSKELSGVDTFLNKAIQEGYVELKINLETEKAIDGTKREKKGTAQGSEVAKGRELMCSKYYDIRTFGAVLSTGANAGQVRGPVQITFARSIDPVIALEHALTVCSARKEEDSYESQVGIQGRKFTIPYGLYLTHGFISAHLAEQTGFNEDDLKLFWDALKTMFDHDHSAARGMMSTRKLLVFKHSTALGNAPAHVLFDLVKVERINKKEPARVFSHYSITSKEEIEKRLPQGVELIEML